MHFSLILIGLLFVFSPDLSIFDFLPDFIGWFFITLGLSKFADIESRGEDAKKLALRMILFSAVKLFLSLFTFRYGTADMLLITFSYSVVELVTVIPFCTNFFMGLDYSSMRIGCSLDSEKLGTVKLYLQVFFIVKNLFAFLPATVAFFDTEATGEFSANTWFIDFEAAMRSLMVIGFLFSVIMSVVMISYFTSFFVKLIKNKELISKMKDYRKDMFLKNPNLLIKKNISFVLTFFSFALVFFADFYIDSLDILPTFVAFLLIFVASLYLKKQMRVKVNLLIISSLLGFALSLINFIYRLFWATKSKFNVEYIFADKKFSLILGSLNALFIILVVFLTFRCAKLINSRYTKTELEDSTALLGSGGVILGFFAFILYSFPNLNTTYVFPSIIYFAVFISIAVNYLSKLKKQISKDLR